MNTLNATKLLGTLSVLLLVACKNPTPPEPESMVNTDSSELEAMVSQMAKIGWATDASHSPDGTQIAFLSSESGLPQVWIHDLATQKNRQVTFLDDPVSNVEWSPVDDTLAISVAPGGGLNSQIYLTNSDGDTPKMITQGGDINNWLGMWSADGKQLAFGSNARGTSVDAYLYSLQDQQSHLIAENPGIGVVADLSPNGGRAVIWRMRSRGNTDLYLLDIETKKEHLLTPHQGVALSDSALFLDDDTLFVTTNVDRERVALGQIEINADGSPGPIQIRAEREDAELGEITMLANKNQVALLWNVAGKSELAFYDVNNNSEGERLSLPGEIASSMVSNASDTYLAFTVSGAAVPQNVWLMELDTNEFSQISQSRHDGISLDTLVSPTLVRYKAHDGVELSGWLYRPSGSRGPIPLVTSFHGGPEGQERPRFRTTYQALLSRGIGVFAPNVRGSSGFGKTFVNLDNGALRVNAVKDIEATVKHLIDAGIADPRRIGIMGGSYGGYMVMAGLASYPRMFAAGANLFGVVNFETFFANTEPWMAAISTVEYGDPATEADMLRQLSPIHQVDQVKAPTIVLHGANDTNVPVVEAEQVVNSLKARKVPVKYVLFPDEGHGWRKTVNRVTSDVEIVRWFETHLNL